MNAQYDVIIIGGGVVGSAVARELSRYALKVAVLEKELDVCNGVSGHNTGLLHSALLYEKGTMRCECCLEGNEFFEQAAEELGVPFRRCGKLIVGFGAEERKRLDALFERGVGNGVPGLRMIDHDELKAMEPSADGDFAIFVPSAGILDPFTYTIALAENAAMNGVKYHFDSEVTGIERGDGVYSVTTSRGERFSSRWVINCAGLYSYKISGMLGYKKYVPNRVKGQYLILDKHVGSLLSMPVYPTPNETGDFDVHVTPTIDGNILVGPTIENVGAAEVEYSVTQEMIDSLAVDGRKMFEHVQRAYYIRNYAGIFPNISDPDTGETLTDFRIETNPAIPNTINLVSIISPGLTSSLPLARRVVKILADAENPEKNESFNPVRKPIERFADKTKEEQAALIEKDPDYGEIFCRCECVTMAEIKQAAHNILGVDTVSGIKYRTRATMGRCQGGYCETRITKLLQTELGKTREEIRLNKTGAYMFTGEVK